MAQAPAASTISHAASRVGGLLLALLVAGCSATGAPVVRETNRATPAQSPSDRVTDAIRSIDPASLEWRWFSDFSDTHPVDLGAPDEYGRTYTVGAPVYSDADGDGLEDMAVPLAQHDGNGFREQWYVWLAGSDGGATQMMIPIAWTMRCGDDTRSVKATDGGFVVRERLREPVVDDHLPCSKPGTFASTRRVAVQHVGDGLYPVNLADPRGYGGVCPTHPRTEARVVKVWGSAVPEVSAPLTIDGERMYLILTSAHTLTRGADPMRLASVWPPDGKADQRLCIWIDPARYEGSGG